MVSNVNGQFNNDIGFPSGVGTTTDGTSTVNIFQKQAFYNSSDAAGTFTFDVIGIDFANSQVAAAKIVARIKKVSGTLSVDGTPVHVVPFNANSSPGLVTCAASVTVSGSNVRVNVIGVAGRTIYWTCKVSPSLSVLDNYDTVSPPSDTDLLTWNDGYGRWDPLSRADITDGVPVGGDLSGTLPNPTVVKIQGRAVDSGIPSSGQVLQWNGSQWNLTTYGGDVTGSPSASTVTKLQGRAVSSSSPPDGYTLVYRTGTSRWEIEAAGPPIGLAGGDLTGSFPNPTVVKAEGSQVGAGINRQIIVGGGSIPANGGFLIIAPEDKSVSAGSVTTGGGTSLEISSSRGNSAGGSALLRSGGIMAITAGNGYNDGAGGNVNIQSGTSSAGAAGDIQLIFGDGTGSTKGYLVLSNPNTASSASSGAASALPGQPVGYLAFKIGTTTYKIPYYGN